MCVCTQVCGSEKSREAKVILSDINGIIRPGELWAIIGANGAGV